MTRGIPLSRGLIAIVDDEDYDRVMAFGPWHALPNGGATFYARHSISARQQINMHAFILGCKFVDHANGNGLDNRRSNLRPATHAQNTANSRLPCTNTSGYRGVTQNRRSGRWIAQIGYEGRTRNLGSYDTREEAALAYDAAALTHFGEFARLNFPEGIAS